MKYLVGSYYNGSFGAGTLGPYKVYMARNKKCAEKMYQWEFGYLPAVVCSVFRNKSGQFTLRKYWFEYNMRERSAI